MQRGRNAQRPYLASVGDMVIYSLDPSGIARFSDAERSKCFGLGTGSVETDFQQGFVHHSRGLLINGGIDAGTYT